MKKSPIIKLLALVLAIMMTVTLFACDNNETKETEPDETQAKVEETTEANTATDAPAVSETEESAESQTDADTEPATEPVTDPATDAVTEPATETPTEPATETPTEPATETPTEPATETPTEPETEGETIPSGPAEPLCETCSFKTVKGVPICKVCGYVAPCLGVHDYVGVVEGHNKPACEHCGKAAGKMQNHEYTEYVEDEGDLLYYSYVCDICYFVAYAQEVPYEINLFYPASEISNASASGGVEGAYRFVSGIGYGEFARAADVAGANSTIAIEDSGSIEDDPVGQYMAVRIRLPRSQTSITIEVKSVHADEKFSYKINGLKPGWVTLAIDLSKFAKPTAAGGVMGYVPDNFGDFYLERVALTTYVGSGESIDIAYAVFCEEKEDLMTFVGGDTNCYFYEDVLAKAPEITNPINCEHNFVVDEENGTHTLKDPCFECGMASVLNEEHSYIEIIGGGKNSYECSVCGYAKYLKIVPETINKYVSASELNAGGIIYYPYTKFNHGLYIEPGDAYTRYEGPLDWKDDVAQVIFARDDADQNPIHNGDAENGIRINVGDAIYFVLRVRVNTDNLTPLWVTISTTEHAGFDTGEGNSSFSIPVGATPKDTWNVYVVNLKEIFPTKYIANSDGDYVVDTFYFNMCSGTFDEGVTLDLSYMAYCSTWEEVAAIVDEEQLFYLSDSTGSGNWADTETRKCTGECTLGDANITEDKEAGTVTYEFKCSVCGNAVTKKTIDSSVTRYYYAGELANTATTYYQVNGAANGRHGQIVHDKDTGRVFSRYTGFEKEVDGVMTPQTAQVLWQRAQEDMWDGQTAGKNEKYTESVGNAEWLVMRVKTNNPEQKFYFNFSTTEYNTVDANLLGRKNGMLEIQVPLAASEADEWTTYVVNLKDMFPNEYAKDSESGEYIIDTFYFTFSKFATTTNVDIEYFAFVEGGWDELDALIDEEVAVVISDQTGGHGFADVATGECLEGMHAYGYSSVTDAEGNMTNTIACAVCGDTKLTQNVSKDVNKFFDVTQAGCFNQKIHNDASVKSGYLDVENGVSYTRLSMNYGNTHFILSGGNNANAGTSYTISTGSYAVIKLRTNGARSIGFDAQTGDNPSHIGIYLPRNDENTEEWMVWVIDLSVYTPEAAGANGYTVNSEQTVKFRFTTGNAKSAENVGDYVEGSGYAEDPFYLDVAYFAIVDSIDEAKGMITDESYTLFANGLNNPGEEQSK